MQKRILSATCIIFVAGPLYASEADPEAALDGYGPVRLVKMNNLVKGAPKLSSVYDGRRYLFPSPEQKRMFDSKPTAFVPALGGTKGSRIC